MSVCAQPEPPNAPRRHERHRPEKTLLHAVVSEHLSAFVRHADEHYARPLPRYVKRAFEGYLRCGIPELGFLRLRCEDCGHDRIVAFSCKERGTCPSCAGRTMTNTAAHLVDRVLPNVPIRQWVLSLPFELRALAAKHPDVVSAIDRILFREVERYMRHAHGPRAGRAGAVTFVQRFGGSLNLHVHFHVLFLEGLFTRDAGNDHAPPVFHPASSPTRGELLAVLTRVQSAVSRWLARRGLANTAAIELDALDACANVAIQPGLFDKLAGDRHSGNDADHDEPAGLGRNSVSVRGFNLHAAVTVGADDDRARERLVRYCARPPFALERLSLLPDGRIAYRMKQPRRGGATHRILEPIELIARMAALIPPPRHPFLRYHGVLAPSSKWRSLIVPRPDEKDVPASPCTNEVNAMTTSVNTTDANAASTTRSPPPPLPSGTATRVVPPNNGPKTPNNNGGALRNIAGAPNNRSQRADYARITAAHRARLVGGELLARGPRVDWATLLRRTFACEVLVCPRCTGRARVIAALHEPAEARRFLEAIDQRSIPTPLAHRRTQDDDAELRSHDDNDELTGSYAAASDEQEPPPPSYEPPPPSSQPPTPAPDD